MLARIALVAGLFVGACTVNPVQEATRDAARRVVTPILQDRFPGLPAAQLAECVIDNATTYELLEIVEGATVGAGADTYAVVIGIAQRPEVLRCAAINVLPAL